MDGRMTFTFTDPNSIPWQTITTLDANGNPVPNAGSEGSTVLFYGRFKAPTDANGNVLGPARRGTWHGQGTWTGGKPTITDIPDNLIVTHWLAQGNYEVTT
jgi:hypothetical protein